MTATRFSLPCIIALILSCCGAAFAQGKLAVESGTPVATGGPFDRVHHPENAPALADAAAFPQEWRFAYGNTGRNAAYSASAEMPAWLKEGVSWTYAEARAWDLKKAPFSSDAIGEASSDTTMTQWMGNAVGVSVVGGVVYAESDDQFVYAINARNGKLIWRTSPVATTFMGQPIVHGDMVYVNAGTVGFNFSNAQLFGKPGKSPIRGAGVAFNGIYALDRKTGEVLWHFDTKGDVMPTPALDDGKLILSTGTGEVFALDAATGRQIWVHKLPGMGNMSSPAIYKGKVYVGMSVPASLACLDAGTGALVWKGEIQGAVNTGMGDVSPAVSDGVVVTDAVSSARTVDGKVTMDVSVRAFDAGSGKTLWTHMMGRGPKPPSFKGGVPMIHDGVVYVGAPVRSEYQALDLKTGALRWTWAIPNPGPAGAGRGPATFHDGSLYISTVGSLFALDPKTGALLGKKTIGGRFGIVSPTIVGGTMYLGNSWDWILALPISEVNPTYRPAKAGS